MTAISRLRGRASVGAATLAVGALIVSAFVGAPPAAAATPTAHPITVSPQVRHVGSPHAGADAVTFNCQTRPLDGSQGPRCYQPAQIQTAYGISPLLKLGKNGAGRTIVIIDAFGSPTMLADLQAFDATFGLPDPSFTQIAPAGSPPAFDPNDSNQIGWAFETTLDVEWAHAVAPGANIVLAIAKSNEDTDILNTTRYVIEHNLGDVISQSFGEAESCVDPQLLAQQHDLFAKATRNGITLFASSGDSGAAQPSCDGSSAVFAASSPASDPNVTGVGGTTLDADTTTGAYRSETAWTEPFGCNPPAVAADDVNCSGGGFSSVYRRPLYQVGAVSGSHGRGVPDVAYDAGVAGGVLVECSFCNVIIGGAVTDPPIFFISGGTSAGSPQWAGLAAIADQIGRHRMGNINPALYGIALVKPAYRATLHDITVGNNDVSEIGTGFDTARGWDPVTGLGSPIAVTLLPSLAALAR